MNNICTSCGKGELQEITGTALLYCPICHSKLINPDAKLPDPWKSLTLQEKEQVMQFLEDAAKVKKQFDPVPVSPLPRSAEELIEENRKANEALGLTDEILSSKEWQDLKWKIGQIMWDNITLSEDGKSIECNPSTHIISAFVYHKLHSKSQLIPVTEEHGALLATGKLYDSIKYILENHFIKNPNPDIIFEIIRLFYPRQTI